MLHSFSIVRALTRSSRRRWATDSASRYTSALASPAHSMSCGAVVNGAFCEYCGARMPVERVETQTIHAENVTVNNYYVQPGPQARAYSSGPAAGRTPVAGASPKSRTAALLLCVFLGVFGAHRFYARRYVLGAVYFFTFGLLGIGWLADLVLIALGSMRDGDGLPIVNW